MTVAELRAALASMPDGAEVVCEFSVLVNTNAGGMEDIEVTGDVCEVEPRVDARGRVVLTCLEAT